MRDVELDPPRPRTAVDRGTTMFASTPSTCTRRTLDLPRKDWDIRYLRYLGNSDIANQSTLLSLPEFGLLSDRRYTGLSNCRQAGILIVADQSGLFTYHSTKR